MEEEQKTYLPALTESLDWPPGLPMEVALLELYEKTDYEDKFDIEVEINHLIKQFDIDRATYDKISKGSLFRKDVLEHKQAIKNDDGTLKRKAKMIAEGWLTSFAIPMMKGELDVKPSAKDLIELYRTIAKIAGVYDNAKSDVQTVAESMAKANQPSIVINLPPQAEMPRIAERVL